MKRGTWSSEEIADFLHLEEIGRSTREIVGQLGRTTPAINAMRRKVRILRGLHVTKRGELLALLAAPLYVIESRSLAVIREVAKRDLVKVKPFLRTSRATGRPGLVGEHERNRSGV